MSKILIIAEHLNGQLNQSTAKCVSCASKIAGATIDILVLAADPAPVAAQAAAIAGVSRVRTLANAANANAMAAIYAPQIVAIAAEYTHVFGPSTTMSTATYTHTSPSVITALSAHATVPGASCSRPTR